MAGVIQGTDGEPVRDNLRGRRQRLRNHLSGDAERRGHITVYPSAHKPSRKYRWSRARMGTSTGVTLQGGTNDDGMIFEITSGWRTDHAVQLLPAKRVCRWRLSRLAADPGYRRNFLRVNNIRWATGYGVVSAWTWDRAVRGNTARDG